MNINVQPAETYEALKIQFFAMKSLLQCRDVEREIYRKKMQEFDFQRIIQLEAELASEREMNAILTDELEKLQKVKS
jgi:hypothetical protein